MTATPPPFQDADQQTITTLPSISPYSRLWWTTQTISGIPADSVGWLVSQGWQITNIVPDNTTVPPTQYYSMTRESLQNWMVLQNLLDSYTIADNDAKEANETRYNDIVTDWQEMLTSTQEYMETQTEEQNAAALLYLGNLDTYMTNVESLVNANADSMTDAIQAATNLMITIQGEMDDYENAYGLLIDQLMSDYEDYEVDFSAILNLLPTDYEDGYKVDYSAILDLLPTDYENGYKVDYSAVLNYLPEDYDYHAITAKQFLDGLGATELSRINEKFAASLSTQLQMLTDSGLYNSTIAADVRARNTRDKNEEIVALNDRLNREKLENQHRLFEQQVAMRGRTLDGTDKLYDRKTAMRGHMLDGTDKLYDRQVAMRGHMLDGTDKMYDRKTAAHQATMASRERLHTLKQELLKYRIAQELQNADAMTSHRNKAIVELMNVYMARLEGQRGVHADNMKLMAYQLDERNKLMIGLYGFVERREDVGPSFKDLAQVCTALGDSGGGWVTP